MKKGRPKKLSETLNERPIINLDIEPISQVDEREERIKNLVNKMKGRASIYTEEEIQLMDEVYQEVGKEGSICRTCPQSIGRAIEIILIHYK